MPKFNVNIETTDYRAVNLEIEATDADAAEAEAQRIYSEGNIAWDDEGTLELSIYAEPITPEVTP